MRNRSFRGYLIALTAALLASCSSTVRVKHEEAAAEISAPPKPAIVLRVASLDLFNYRKRIEKKDIETLANLLKSEQIEILTVQGISRYAKVEGRTDFVDELAARMEMHHVFGETVNNPGWQEGNAIFSIYPIRSSRNTEYEIKSANFESALQVAVDAGVKDVVIVSTRLPEKATNPELASCVRTMLRLRSDAGDPPFIVIGNLPVATEIRAAEKFVDVQILPGVERGQPASARVWYIEDNTLKVIQARSAHTEFGTITVAEFGLFSAPHL